MTLAVLGQRIKQLRKSRGLSQEDLAEKASISAKYLSDLERGKRNPTFSTAEKIAEGLGVDLARLITGRDAEDDDEAAVFDAVSGIVDQKDPEKLRRLRTFLEEVFR